MKARDANVELNLKIIVLKEKNNDAPGKIQRISGTEDETA